MAFRERILAAAEKPLKRFSFLAASRTGLKPGVNENVLKLLLNPKGIQIIQPSVDAQRLRWVRRDSENNPERVASNLLAR